MWGRSNILAASCLTPCFDAVASLLGLHHCPCPLPNQVPQSNNPFRLYYNSTQLYSQYLPVLLIVLRGLFQY